MNVIAISQGGAEKAFEFEGFAPRGGWAECRAQNVGGIYAFSLRHGAIECKRGEHPKWRLSALDLEKLRELAREQKVKFSTETPKASRKGVPRKPIGVPDQRQTELFK